MWKLAYFHAEYLGLITVDKLALRYGKQELYTFLHLTFQEFLAAYHISHLEEEEQARLIDEYGSAKQMQAVWKFYCGLVRFDETTNLKLYLIDHSMVLYTKFNVPLNLSDPAPAIV